MNDLFIEIPVWKRLDSKRAVKFNCIKNAASGKYNVQSADFYYAKEAIKEREFQQQFVDLFIELPPEERVDWYNSIEEAIAAHEREFAKSC